MRRSTFEHTFLEPHCLKKAMLTLEELGGLERQGGEGGGGADDGVEPLPSPRLHHPAPDVLHTEHISTSTRTRNNAVSRDLTCFEANAITRHVAICGAVELKFGQNSHHLPCMWHTSESTA